MDFVSDQLCDGRRFRALTIVDIYTRESLAIEAGQSLRGEDVVRVLNRLKLERGAPKMLFCDNGSEQWRQEYNVSRPHRALADRTPAEFARQIALKRDLTETKTGRELTL